MQMSSSSVRKHQFKKRFPGFDPEEVAQFLEEVSEGVDTIQKQNTELSRKVTELETQLKDFRMLEKALQQTLMQAQESTAKAVDQARKEAQLIIQDAELKAAQLLEKSRSDLTTLKEQTTILRAKKESIVNRLKMLLTSELDVIRALEVEEEPGKPESPHSGRGGTQLTSEIEEIIRTLEA